MAAESVGLWLWRESGGDIEVLLGHMGGPFWAKKHEHAWSIPKGLRELEDPNPLSVAEREFTEEMGSLPPRPVVEDIDLGVVRTGKKRIRVFARRGEFAADYQSSNDFEMEWPPRSGTIRSFPEIDRAEWVSLASADQWLTKGQGPFAARLRSELRSR